MSRIRRLSIRGIRNFGEDNDDNSIRFYRPLTLILGPNGTGKTTIIEALKFATCGEFPPGSDRGKFFIHDPALSIASSVRGVVKAEVIDAKGNIYTICRTIESAKGPTTAKFKTLDSTLSRMNKGSTKVISITNRCANVDTELTLAMGVSKPILDYVIFCHQEDLNWPFQDGKKLKEKFDEIFDSARFNKALESIMKHTKDLQHRVNVLKEQKQNSQTILNEVKDKETKLEDHKKRLENARTKVTEINAELEPVKQRMEKLEETDTNYKNLQNEEKRRKAEYDMYKQQMDRLKEGMVYVFEGTREELLKQINSYDEDLKEKTERIGGFEEKIKDITREESRISNILANERVSTGSLRQQLKEQEKKISVRNKILNDALIAYSFDTIDSNVSELEVSALSKRLERKVREEEEFKKQDRIEMEDDEKELQKVVDTLRSEYSKVESEKNLKENDVLEIRNEISAIKSEIMKLGDSTNKLNSIESKIKEVQKIIQELEETINIDAAKEEVAEKIKSRNKIETLLNTIDEEISLLLKQSSLQTELELNKSALLAKEKEFEKLKHKHEEKIKALFDIEEVTQTKLKSNLDAVQKQLTNEIESINEKIQTEERKTTMLVTTISHRNSELQTKKKTLNLDKEKVSSVCQYTSFNEDLLLQSTRVKDLQDKRGIYAHQGAAYKEYMKQLKETNPCCPLCHRGFEERETVVNLLKEMENETKNHPNRLKECERELKIQQEKYDKMLQLKPVIERIVQFEEVELEKLTMKLGESRDSLTISQTATKELKEKKSDPEKKLTVCKDIMGDIILWDRYIDEISKLKKTIDEFHDRMAAAGIKTKRSLEEAQTEREELKTSLKDMRDDIEKLQTKINAYNERIHNARQEHNVLHEEQLKIRSDIPKLKELKDKREALYSKEISLGEEVDTLREKVVAAKSELNAGIEKLEKKKKDNWERLEVDRNMIAAGEKQLSELEKAQAEVDSILSRDIPKALEASELKIQNYEELLNELIGEKSDAETGISKLKEDINRQEVRKRELSDNVSLREIEETTNKVQKAHLSIQEQLNAINHSKITKELEEIQNRIKSLLSQKSMIKGSEGELERAVEQYTQELKKEIYRQARKVYKSKCIELMVVEQAILNLKAYSKALDTAMIEYHVERMATVNKIMKDMWRLVYTGTDTTAIQIRTDATEGVGSARRTYNYKLVQTKHGHEIDMKGRCSAGQKVLASIIIRLALAETFCKDCGILALDEPTTNLDQENADSLANALATVVRLRSRHQKNFQLVVISHDEKFLFKLAELSSNRGFYQLYRKDSGFSAIRHCLVENQQFPNSDSIKAEMSSEEESDENSELQDKSESSAHETTSKKKRQISDVDNDDEVAEIRATKKRFILK